MLRWIWSWLVAFVDYVFNRPSSYRIRRVSDAPDKLERGIVYVVGADGYDWSALMRCPGKCGKTLEMNLLPTARPVWRLTEHADAMVSLHPSVWLKTGCRCHFVLRQGRVKWV